MPAIARDRAAATTATNVRMFTPSAEAIAASQLTAFVHFCEAKINRPIRDSDDLYKLSIEDFRLFWQLFLAFSGLRWEGDDSPVCTSDDVETASFFPNLKLSYAENLLACETAADLQLPAVASFNRTGLTERLNRGELRRRVDEFAGGLRTLGVNAGDRVVSVLRNDAGAVVAGLGSATVGAIFSSASPEIGISGLLTRFGQLDPSVLIVSSIESPGFEMDRLRGLAERLPSLRAMVILQDCSNPLGFSVPIYRASEFSARCGEWTRYPFNHPLLILFTSGTTGSPKCIVHSAGGTLLEHLKEHLLHGDLRRGDKMFFHTSTGWMMWNWQLSALATGAEIVLYDGAVTDPDDLWRIVAEEQVTAFGTSPTFLRMCQNGGYSPRRRGLDLTQLRSIMSTGAILYDDQYYWARDNVGAVPLESISGGTDIVGCFVLGNPNLPVYVGESQCRSFGLDVRALVSPERGGCVGDLICAKPFPSRPLGIYGDAAGERFHRVYFSEHPGVWTHGDLIEITPRGTARMHGRSDGVLNIRGIRIGPAEIYRVLASFPEIQESMVVEQATPGAVTDSRMVLVIVMSPSHSLDARLRARIRTALAQHASPAHIPSVIVDVPEIPVTHNGKQCELAATEALKGNDAANLSALRNPKSLEAMAARVAAYDARTAAASSFISVPAATLEEELTRIWERVLDVSPIGPHDNFFQIGGTSLLTAPLFQQVAVRFRRRLPLSTILHAPTISSLASLLRDDRGESWGSLELLKPGDTQRPLFIAPGLFGEPLGLQPLAQHIGTNRAIYGLRSRGLMDGEQPLDRVEAMAQIHFTSIRALQPRGPYSLLGFSLGGAVVLEIARDLLNAGERVDFLGLIDAHLDWACLLGRERIAQALLLPLRWPRAITLDLPRNLRRFVNERRGRHAVTGLLPDEHALRVTAAGFRAQQCYSPQPYPGDIVYFRASVQGAFQYDPTAVWARLARGFTVRTASGHHEELIRGGVHELGLMVSLSLNGTAQVG